jgi:hypothetical protein
MRKLGDLAETAGKQVSRFSYFYGNAPRFGETGEEHGDTSVAPLQ